MNVQMFKEYIIARMRDNDDFNKLLEDIGEYIDPTKEKSMRLKYMNEAFNEILEFLKKYPLEADKVQR